MLADYYYSSYYHYDYYCYYSFYDHYFYDYYSSYYSYYYSAVRPPSESTWRFSACVPAVRLVLRAPWRYYSTTSRRYKRGLAENCADGRVYILAQD